MSSSEARARASPRPMSRPSLASGHTPADVSIAGSTNTPSVPHTKPSGGGTISLKVNVRNAP